MTQTVRDYAEAAADEAIADGEILGIGDGFDGADEFIDYEMNGDAGDQCFVHKVYAAEQMREALRAAYDARRDGEFFR